MIRVVNDQNFPFQALQNMGVETKNTNAELSLEIIGILKRTFSQPAIVKSMLYRRVFLLSVHIA